MRLSYIVRSCSQNRHQYLPEISATNEGGYDRSKNTMKERGSVITHSVTRRGIVRKRPGKET